MDELCRRQFLATLLVPAAAGLGAVAVLAQAPSAAIPAADRMRPAQLVQRLRGSGAKPLILQVGFATLYQEAHIPGAVYAGPAGQPAGLQALRKSVQAVAKNHPIVIYCGCCPWVRCPNIRAAYQALTGLGFTRVKALYIADNFGAEWVKPGYPVTPAR